MNNKTPLPGTNELNQEALKAACVAYVDTYRGKVAVDGGCYHALQNVITAYLAALPASTDSVDVVERMLDAYAIEMLKYTIEFNYKKGREKAAKGMKAALSASGLLQKIAELEALLDKRREEYTAIVVSQNAKIKAFEDDKEFIYKQVERALFDEKVMPGDALWNIAHYPAAPWAKDSGFTWDVTHKNYGEVLYKHFPHARPTPPDNSAKE